MMTEDMEVTINSIDMDFLSQYYKDEKDNNLVRYSLMFDTIDTIIDQSTCYLTAENQKRIKGEISPKKVDSDSDRKTPKRSRRPNNNTKRSSSNRLGDYEAEQKRARKHLGDNSDTKSQTSQLSKSTKGVFVKLRAHVKKKKKEEAVVNALYDNDSK